MHTQRPPSLQGLCIVKVEYSSEAKMSQGRPEALGRPLGEAPWGGIPPGLQIMRKNTCQMHVNTPLAYKLYVNSNKNNLASPPEHAKVRQIATKMTWHTPLNARSVSNSNKNDLAYLPGCAKVRQIATKMTWHPPLNVRKCVK